MSFIWRRYGPSHAWEESEDEVLREHYAAGDRASLLAQLPNRSWSSITFQTNLLGLHRIKPQANNTPVHKYEAHLEWASMQENGIEFNDSWGSIEVFWVSEE